MTERANITEDQSHLNLFIENYSTKYNLRKSLGWEHAKRYSSDGMFFTALGHLQKNQVFVFSSVHREAKAKKETVNN